MSDTPQFREGDVRDVPDDDLAAITDQPWTDTTLRQRVAHDEATRRTRPTDPP